MKSRKGCWNCAARKIRCDGGLPTCGKCAQSQIHCQGYEPRLSWPRDDDNRRAMVVNPLGIPTKELSVRPSTLFLINTTFNDMELYGHRTSRMYLDRLVTFSPILPNRPQVQAEHTCLLQYFQDTAYRSLVTFGATTGQIRDALMTMTMAADTSSGLALLYALLAYSSFHSQGPNKEAMTLKIQAVQYLSVSLKEGPMTTARAAQHVAASMLLGAFETLLPSDSSGEWLWHIWGAMDTIRAAQLENVSHESDTRHLLDWVYYHGVLSRFAVHHWRHQSLIQSRSNTRGGPPGDQYLQLSRYRPTLPSPNPTYAILTLLSEVCETLVDPRDPRSRHEDYIRRLKELESRIDTVSVTSTSAKLSDDATFAVELYQVATRIYLARASQSPWEPPANLDALIETGFSGPSKICTSGCEHFFPLLILACEARRDDQRVAILNLVERTQRDSRIRTVRGVMDAIQSIWVQQDLHADGDILVNYLDVMSAGISSTSTIPSFA
ncbi:Zn(2)-C6 fungal-type domain-containing protein [Fusarium keratoplasticum]|uniref:Zn(2)-C6 fungal-type domain-containing protein n=1 Tax=Fusarium keratoplasticum TaxID=1328300 RepID=A0ACC0QRG0_9HYPO|nr:Zn(2)-C6 fungal-type domain-containing protein [Fusarium keratoplasticum]KAI8663194.1 Zn(2)-C6 fungal-type domain-containing protein [Fusarium keratoplasticum]